MNLYLLALTIFPSLLILWFFVKNDKFPEPTNVIIKVFIWGIVISIPIFFINTYLLFQIPDKHIAMFPAAFVEEGFKFLVFYFIVLKLKDFDEPMDALVYGVTVSLGFATLENIYYVYFSDFSIIYGSTLLASIRAISAIPAHAAFGCLMGYFMLKYHFQKSTLDILLAFLIPSIIHFVYNFSMFFGSLIIVIAIVLALILINIFILKKIKVQQLRE